MDNYILFHLVTNRPAPNLTPENACCPSCKSEHYHSLGNMSTLVGGGKENNHVWSNRKCKDCGLDYCVESKHGNTWITDPETRVIREGMPACFENYVYTCNCGGRVTRRYTQEDGKSLVGGLHTSFEDGKAIKHYRTFYECGSCLAEIETDQDYWSPNVRYVTLPEKVDVAVGSRYKKVGGLNLTEE